LGEFHDKVKMLHAGSPMSLVRQQAAFLGHVRDLLEKAGELGFLVTGGELFRTKEQQALYVQNGLSKTMNSRHLKRLAVDLHFFIEQANGALTQVEDVNTLQPLGDFWENLDPANRWGGNWKNFKDTPHFERREDDHSVARVETMEQSERMVSTHLISAPVGVRCPNHRDDVETIQRMLNFWVHKNLPGLETPLTTDGLFGPKTLGAITGFQQAVVDLSSPDGIISVGGLTMAELCRELPHEIDNLFLSMVYIKASKKDIDLYTPHICRTLEKYAINTPGRQAHFLAQTGHESGELRFREEIADGRAYENRRDLGNTRPGDGPKFKGRGLIQLTGRANYQAYGRDLGRVDELLSTPEIVAEDPALCVDVAGWYWDRRGLNESADQDDLEDGTRKINGGLNGLEDRQRILDRAGALLNTAGQHQDNGTLE
jgi:predicted chitinase